MLGKARQAARPRSVQFAAAELQRSTTRRDSTANHQKRSIRRPLKKELPTLNHLSYDTSVVKENLVSLASPFRFDLWRFEFSKERSPLHPFQSTSVGGCRVVEQVVAADGSCTLLGHAACNQFTIILDGKGKIG